MGYTTILAKKSPDRLTVTFNRPSHQNSINAAFLMELKDVLDAAERDPTCRLVVLEGQEGVFCTGMDFEEFGRTGSLGEAEQGSSPSPRLYMEIIKRFALSPKVIISKVDGRVMAGGVGLVAVSDLVIATPRSQFSLSEALWGLLPAMVTPYLIRRVGYQKAYSMTLTTLPVSAQEAHAMHLVDEVSEAPEDAIRRLWLRLRRLEESTVTEMKQYFRKMWLITQEMEETAVAEISKLTSSPKVAQSIRNFVEKQQFPWEVVR